MIRILHGSQLAFQQDVLAFFDRFPQISRYITYIRLYHLLVFHQLFVDILCLQSRCMVQMLQNNIFLSQYTVDLLHQIFFASEQLAHLEADLCIFV